MKRFSRYFTLCSCFFLLSCGRPALIANYPSKNAASEECLNDIDAWIKEELGKPPLKIGDGGNTGEDFTILKNENGEHEILDVYCKPIVPKGQKVAVLMPYVRYMQIPVDDFELHETKDVIPAFYATKGKEYTYSIE